MLQSLRQSAWLCRVYLCWHYVIRDRWHRRLLVSSFPVAGPTCLANDYYSHRLNGQQGSLYYNGSTSSYSGTSYSIYAAAYMIQAGPGTICPYYNGMYYTNPVSGNVYQVWCQTDLQAGTMVQYNSTGSACSLLLQMSFRLLMRCRHVQLHAAMVRSIYFPISRCLERRSVLRQTPPFMPESKARCSADHGSNETLEVSSPNSLEACKTLHSSSDTSGIRRT